MFGFIKNFMPIKGWLIVAFGLLLASSLVLSKLLLNSHEQNGSLQEKLLVKEDETARLKSVNEELANAHDKRVAEFYELQKKQSDREVAKETTIIKTDKIRADLRNIKDETNVRDVIVPNVFWLLIKRGASGE